MTTRFYTIAVVTLWMAAMGWLVQSKILPALREGTPPDYRAEFQSHAARQPQPVAWDLFWNAQPIGSAISQAYLSDGEPSELRSLVQFEKLEVREIAQELLGGLSFLTSSLFGNESLRVNLTIGTRIRLDWEGELQGFETGIRAANSFDLLFLRGVRTDDDRLRISVLTSGSTDATEAIKLGQEFDLPSKARLAEAFSPRSQMTGLHIGQQWTTPVISPLPGSSSIRLVESLVERQETIDWHDESVEVFVVVYRYDAGSSGATRDPVGTVWVRQDGMVLRQQLPIGKAQLRMERASDTRAKELAVKLDARDFDHYLHQRTKTIGPSN